MSILTRTEGNILLYIQEHIRTSFATGVFKTASFVGEYGWIFILFVMGLLVFRKTRRIGAYCAVSLILEFLLTNMVFKVLISRDRPYVTFPGIIPLGVTPLGNSFPSGHAGAAFAVAFIFFRKAPRRYGIPVIIVASLIGISRVYLGVHYPTDVLGGVALGFATSMVSEMIIGRWEERKKEKMNHE